MMTTLFGRVSVGTCGHRGRKARKARKALWITLMTLGLSLFPLGQPAAASWTGATPDLYFMDRVAAIVTHPAVAPIILMVGIAGVFIEILTAGVGVAGVLGGGCLVLYFAGHYYAGLTGWSAIVLFLIGVLLIIIEAFMPGFGVPGICGILSFVASVIMMAPDMGTGVRSFLIALVGSVVIVAVALRFLSRSKYWDRLSLTLSLGKEGGYISQKEDYAAYIGRKGRAMTALRPAGIVVLDDGKKLDVVSDGEFIEKDSAVVIAAVDGPKILATRD